MKFKVGDRVKIISKNHAPWSGESSNSEFGINQIGYIFECNGDNYTICKEMNLDTYYGLFDDDDIIVIKGGSMKTDKSQKLTWAVKYDKDVDPTEYFETKKEAMERIEELVKDSMISNIVLFHIDKSWNVKTPTKFELEEVK